MTQERFIKIYVEALSGDSFEADVPCGTRISQVAVDFFETQGWPSVDSRGVRQRAVVEQVNPNNPDETRRLNGDIDICESGISEGDTLRILPESRAAAIDQRARHIALSADYNDMQVLCQQNPHITFTNGPGRPPNEYEVTLHYRSFVELWPKDPEPIQAESHKFEIILNALYPRHAPIVRCLTPIFHPNIHPIGGYVCLGALGERYLPGMGLVRVVNMLVDVVQWRNFDASSYYNQEAADWARKEENGPAIIKIGGHPLQEPIKSITPLDRTNQPRIIFRRLSPDQ